MSSLVKILLFNVFNFCLLEIREGCGNLWRLPHLFPPLAKIRFICDNVANYFSKVIQFDGKKYICRIVESIDGEELLIGSTELLDALQPGSFGDANEGFANKEAEALYDEVFYFTEPENLLLPDKD